MASVPNPLLQQYMKLTEFLGLALGPDYEVALHDLTNRTTVCPGVPGSGQGL